MKLLSLAFVLAFSMIASWGAKPPKCSNTFFATASRAWPISFRDKKGQIQGLGHDIAQGIGETTGCRMVVDEVTPFQTWKMLKDDKTDLLLGNIENSGEAAIYGDFVPVFKVRRILVVRSDVYNKDWTLQDYIDSPKVRFSGVIGQRYAYQKGEVETLKKQHLYIETTDYENLLLLLTRKGADATFFTEAAFEHYANELELNGGLVKIPDNNTWLMTGLYVSKKRVNAKDLELIKTSVETLRKDGELDRYLKKYNLSGNNIQVIDPEPSPKPAKNP